MIHIKTKADLTNFLNGKMKKGQRVVLDGGAPFPGLVHSSALVAEVVEHEPFYALFQLTFLGVPFGQVSAQLMDDKLFLNDLQ